MRRPSDRGEQHEDLGQPPVERGGVVRPAQPLEPVPERLALDRVVEQDRVAEVAQVAARDGVDARLVQEQAPHGGGIERRGSRSAASGSVIGATLAATKRARDRSRPRSGPLGQEERGARRQVDEDRLGQPALGEPGQELLAGRERRALVELVELDAGDDLAVPRPELVPLRRQRPVEDEQPPAGSEGLPGRAKDRRGVVELMERVLEVGQVVLAGLARRLGADPGGS